MTYTLNDLTIYSLESENFQKKSKNLGNLDSLPSELCIIYNDDNANPCRYICEAFEESPTDLLMFVGNQKIISNNLIVDGIQSLNEYGAKFVYSDGFLAGKFLQPIYLPPYKPNLIKQNRLILNMPLLVCKNANPQQKMSNIKVVDHVKILPLFFLFYVLTSSCVGYHLPKQTYHTYNFVGDVSQEIKLLGLDKQ
jgi:hypothetical protein